MDYNKATITAAEKNIEAIEAALTLSQINGWEETGKNGTVEIIFYFTQDTCGEEKFNSAIERLKEIPNVKINRSVLKGEDWENGWKKNFKPKKIGKIIVTPPWEHPTSKLDEHIISIEPGMAFGTGEHATTSLCIELIQKYIKKGWNMIDLGTGSAILSMTGALLGANRTVGIDNDPEAAAEASENIKKMRLSDKINIIIGDAQKDVEGTFDIAAANLFLCQVISLIRDGLPFLNKEGIFIGSGITSDQTQEIETAINQSGFLKLLEIKREGLWIAFAAEKIKCAGSL